MEGFKVFLGLLKCMQVTIISALIHSLIACYSRIIITSGYSNLTNQIFNESWPSFTFLIRVWRRWSASLVNTLQLSQNGKLAFLFRSSSATFLLCFRTGVPLMWVVMQFVHHTIVIPHLEVRGMNCCGQLLLICPLRTRSCCLHSKSATKSWCSAITSPSTGSQLTTTCASTSSMFFRTKCLSSLSAYICPSPGYWLVRELIFETLSDLLVFFLLTVNLPLYTLWSPGLYVLLCRTGAIERLDDPVSDMKKKTMV